MSNVGKIVQVIGPVVDVEFSDGLPEIYNAQEIKLENGKKLILEAHQHLGGNKVRAVAMGSTDGLRRGIEVTDTGEAIQVRLEKKLLEECLIFWVKRLMEKKT